MDSPETLEELAREPATQQSKAGSKSNGATQPPLSPEDVGQELRRLADLDPAAYELERTTAAASLGFRTTVLDKQVAALRKEALTQEDAKILVEELEPWPKPVGPEIADNVFEYMSHHVIADTTSLYAATLWVVASYLFDLFTIFAKLYLMSPEKRCGKTTFLLVLEAMVNRSIMASSVTPSAVFRTIEACRPTFLIDEADRLSKADESMNAVLNSGHTKRTARILRSVKQNDDWGLGSYSTWAPTIIAGIGAMTSTVMDRSIVVPMRRKLASERPARLPRNFWEQRKPTRQKLLRWAEDNLESVSASKAEPPSHDNDRTSDNWTPLFAVADALGGNWPAHARAAFKALAVEEDGDDVGTGLLADIRDIFASYPADQRMESKILTGSLAKLEDREWAEFKNGKPITPAALARLLKPYGIKPTDIRFSGGVLRGYSRNNFKEAWAHYLSTSTHPPI